MVNRVNRVANRFVNRLMKRMQNDAMRMQNEAIWISSRTRPPTTIIAINVTNGVPQDLAKFSSALNKIDHGPVHFVKLTRDNVQLACVLKEPPSKLEEVGLRPRIYPLWAVKAFEQGIRARSKKSYVAVASIDMYRVIVPSASTEIESFKRAYNQAEAKMDEIGRVLNKHGFNPSSKIYYDANEISVVGYHSINVSYPRTETDVAKFVDLIVDLDAIHVDTKPIKSQIDEVAQRIEKNKMAELENKARLESLGIDHIERDHDCTRFRCLTRYRVTVYPRPGAVLDPEKVLKGLDISTFYNPKVETRPNGVLVVTYEIDSSD